MAAAHIAKKQEVVTMKTWKSRISPGLFVALMSLLIAGCGYQPPKEAVRYGVDYKAQKPAIDRIGLFVDGLVGIEDFASRHFAVRDSAAAITWSARETEAALKAKGYDIAFVEAPFVGGYQPNGPVFSFAASQDTAQHPEMTLDRTPGYLDSDPAYRDALLATSHSVLAALDPAGTPVSQLQTDPAIRAAFMRVAAKRHVRYLFMIQDAGVLITRDYLAVQVGVGALFGKPGDQLRRSFLISYASLIDLQTGEIIWSNWLRFPVFDATDLSDYQSHKWSQDLLYWLPPRGALEVPTR
jgi:hypothetical protein